MMFIQKLNRHAVAHSVNIFVFSMEQKYSLLHI